MLEGKTALITGSLDGIGYAIAEALADKGCAVMLNGFGDAALVEARITHCGNEASKPIITARTSPI
jgi:3-hydroxybutyrate dehydrogenase